MSKSANRTLSSLATRTSPASSIISVPHYAHDDLSTGAAVGVGVCATVVVLVVVAIGAFRLFWRNRNRREARTADLNHEAPGTDPSEEGPKVPSYPGDLDEDGSQPVQEKDGEEVIGELGTKANAHELAGRNKDPFPLYELESPS